MWFIFLSIKRCINKQIKHLNQVMQIKLINHPF